MEEIYRNGYIFPDEFYKKYTNFNSQKDFIKAAQKASIKINLTKTICKFSVKDSIDVIDKFIQENTKFNTWDSFIENAQKLYKEPPVLLPKIFIRSKMAPHNYIARNNYEVECIACKNKVIINEGTLIQKCSCSKFAIYKILKIF